MGDEGQRPEPFHGLADRFVFIRGVPAVAGGGPQTFRFIERGDLPVRAVRNTGGMREQILNRDRAFGRHRRRSAGGQHRGFRERRDEVADRLTQADLAFFNQSQNGGAGERFGLGSDAEQRVGRHGTVRLFVAPPDRLLVNGFAVVKNQRDRAGDLLLVDVLLQQAVDAGEALGGISGVGSGLGKRPDDQKHGSGQQVAKFHAKGHSTTLLVKVPPVSPAGARRR